jgi:hypothetical protein
MDPRVLLLFVTCDDVADALLLKDALLCVLCSEEKAVGDAARDAYLQPEVAVDAGGDVGEAGFRYPLHAEFGVILDVPLTPP